MDQEQFYKSLPRKDNKYPYCPVCGPEILSGGDWDGFYATHKDCRATDPEPATFAALAVREREREIAEELQEEFFKTAHREPDSMDWIYGIIEKLRSGE